jgi:hypothetical protein
VLGAPPDTAGAALGGDGGDGGGGCDVGGGDVGKVELLAAASELVEIATWLPDVTVAGFVTFVIVARILWPAGTVWATVHVS